MSSNDEKEVGIGGSVTTARADNQRGNREESSKEE